MSCHVFRLDRDNEYDFVASGRLGRTQTYQEQYVFIYRYLRTFMLYY